MQKGKDSGIFTGEFEPLFHDVREDNAPLMIAGPCSAESSESVLSCAIALEQRGYKYFRAGLWKPRTRPGAFEGVGAKGLEWLKKVKDVTGMQVMTEVGNASHLALVVAAGLDGIWLGARTVANPFMVQEIADELKRLDATDITILVKNPVNADIELWIGALERLYKAGAHRIGAIHRGFSSYSPGKWRNPPQWAIPIELHRRLPKLPLLHDPSHCSGDAALVPMLAMNAMKLCFNGLMIESHIRPKEALSDASQQITPSQAGDLLNSVSSQLPSSSDQAGVGLRELRDEIDAYDSELVRILAQRMEACMRIGDFKHDHKLPVVQPHRYAALLEEKIAEGEKLGLKKEFLYKIFSEIHAASVELQLRPKS